MLKRPTPVRAPLRFLPRGVGGGANVEDDSLSIWSAVLACEKLSRDSCDWVNAVGVSGMSSSSEIGEGMRLIRSSSISCLGPFQVGEGACVDSMCELFIAMPPAEPLMGYPNPFIPPLLNVGCIGVGIRPLLFPASALNKDGCNMAGRIKLLPNELKAGDSGGWLRTSMSSSSISISMSVLLDSLDMQTGPPYIESGEFAPPCSEYAGVIERMSVNNLGGEGVCEPRWGRFDSSGCWNRPWLVCSLLPGRYFCPLISQNRKEHVADVP